MRAPYFPSKCAMFHTYTTRDHRIQAAGGKVCACKRIGKFTVIQAAMTLFVGVCTALADTNLEIVAFQDGLLTWTNADPNMYYTVEWRSSLTDSTNWTGSFRGCQDIKSTNQVISVPVPLFYRITGSTNPLQTRTLSSTSTIVSAGYYQATNLNQVETDLLAKNIASNVSIFGVTGSLATNAGIVYPAPVPRTGQTPTLPFTPSQPGSDQTYQKGVVWPNPRFSVGSGLSSNCVSDNLTGLMWLRNPPYLFMEWTNAIAYCENLDGTSGRGGYSDWRLPNKNELESLLDFRYASPAFPNTTGTGHWTSGNPFISTASSFPDTANFWSSTVGPGNQSYAWYLQTIYGDVSYAVISQTLSVWPVRGGQ